MSPFTGHKKRKSWNKTREKYMPVKRGQIETDRGSYYNTEDGQKYFQTIKVHVMNVMIVIMNDENYNENNEQQQLS